MTESGGLRANIGSGEHLTPGEDRTLRFAVEDENGDPVTSFSGWTFAWYILPRMNTARTSDDVLLTKVTPTQIIAVAPNVDVVVDPADTIDLGARTHYHELWRTDVDNVVRLAYGTVVFID